MSSFITSFITTTCLFLSIYQLWKSIKQTFIWGILWFNFVIFICLCQFSIIIFEIGG